mmetsp:Transcript_5572/g.13135  ORF Transcript_5572/g.13135 Transcript_5572/m.13135 type:complete len:221 (-) Transcript_5572:3480-4142(-)
MPPATPQDIRLTEATSSLAAPTCPTCLPTRLPTRPAPRFARASTGSSAAPTTAAEEMVYARRMRFFASIAATRRMGALPGGRRATAARSWRTAAPATRNLRWSATVLTGHLGRKCVCLRQWAAHPRGWWKAAPLAPVVTAATGSPPPTRPEAMVDMAAGTSTAPTCTATRRPTARTARWTGTCTTPLRRASAMVLTKQAALATRSGRRSARAGARNSAYQ